MKYRNLVVAGFISVLSVACSKENVEEPSSNKVSNTTEAHLQNSRLRGSDDQVIFTGIVKLNQGQEVLKEEEIFILDAATNEWVKTIHNDETGSFTTHLI